MRVLSTSVLFLVLILLLVPAASGAEPTVLVDRVPQWNIGDSWKYQIDKKLERTVTQGTGAIQITMKLDKVRSTLTYVVTGTATVDGEECYMSRVTGEQTILGTYNTMQLQGEMGSGSITQTASVAGTEYRRVSDLAFVKVEMRSEGTIQLGGSLGGMPSPFQSTAVTVATPPVQVLRFPLVEGDTWTVSSTLTTTASGTSSDSIITSFNYTCTVLGAQAIELKNGETHDCVAISQEGTQTVQSQNAGISIEDIKGALYFAPYVGNRVKDNAEGEELLKFVSGKQSGASQTREMSQTPEHQAESDVTH
jgi:hypothetical protein